MQLIILDYHVVHVLQIVGVPTWRKERRRRKMERRRRKEGGKKEGGEKEGLKKKNVSG